MALILNIDTSSKSTSVALAEDGILLKLFEEHQVVSHASKLTPFIYGILKDVKKKPSDLTAIAISIGPGSYTGLRIGLSVSKGLAYALNIPIIAISPLESMAFFMKNSNKKKYNLYVSTMNSRKNEIYCTLLASDSNIVDGPKVIVLSNSFLESYKSSNILIGGTGVEKVKEILLNDNVEYLEDLNFSALHMIDRTYEMYKQEKFEDLAYLEPEYLKPFITT